MSPATNPTARRPAVFVLLAPLAAIAGAAALSAACATGCGGADTLDDGADATDANTAETGDSASSSRDAADAADAADASDASDVAPPDSSDASEIAPLDGGTRHGPTPVLLGSAADYVMLAKSAISTVPASVITGDLGLSPVAASFATGFSLTRAGTYWTSSQVLGKVFAADNDPPTPTLLTTAVLDMQTAYTDAAGRPTPDFLDLGVGAIGGSTLTPGLYKWSSAVTIGADVTLSGGTNDTWIFQITGNLTESAAKHVILVGGAQAKNVVWQVSGFVSLGATSHFEGVVLCQTDITLKTGASLDGRLYAQTAISLDGNAVTEPAP